MSRSYPIWNQIDACIYKSTKSFGAKNVSKTTIYVGTSRTNSEALVEHVTTRRVVGDFTVFTFSVDCNEGNGLQILKRLWMHTKTREWCTENPLEAKQCHE
jgi:hypothetical protein